MCELCTHGEDGGGIAEFYFNNNKAGVFSALPSRNDTVFGGNKKGFSVGCVLGNVGGVVCYVAYGGSELCYYLQNIAVEAYVRHFARYTEVTQKRGDSGFG